MTTTTGTKTKALCVATRCANVDQFVATYHKFCDESSFFVATLSTRPLGLETAFSIQLADSTPVLRGLCVVVDAWTTPANPFNRPGIRLGIRRLTPDSVDVFTRLVKAARDAPREGASASLAGAPVEPTTVSVVAPVPSPAEPTTVSVVAPVPSPAEPTTVSVVVPAPAPPVAAAAASPEKAEGRPPLAGKPAAPPALRLPPLGPRASTSPAEAAAPPPRASTSPAEAAPGALPGRAAPTPPSVPAALPPRDVKPPPATPSMVALPPRLDVPPPSSPTPPLLPLRPGMPSPTPARGLPLATPAAAAPAEAAWPVDDAPSADPTPLADAALPSLPPSEATDEDDASSSVPDALPPRTGAIPSAEGVRSTPRPFAIARPVPAWEPSGATLAMPPPTRLPAAPPPGARGTAPPGAGDAAPAAGASEPAAPAAPAAAPALDLPTVLPRLARAETPPPSTPTLIPRPRPVSEPVEPDLATSLGAPPAFTMKTAEPPAEAAPPEPPAPPAPAAKLAPSAFASLSSTPAPARADGADAPRGATIHGLAFRDRAPEAAGSGTSPRKRADTPASGTSPHKRADTPASGTSPRKRADTPASGTSPRKRADTPVSGASPHKRADTPVPGRGAAATPAAGMRSTVRDSGSAEHAAGEIHVRDARPKPRAETETRTPGSDFILPANPLSSLTDDQLEGFIDCTLYEETGNFHLSSVDVRDVLSLGTTEHAPSNDALQAPDDRQPFRSASGRALPIDVPQPGASAPEPRRRDTPPPVAPPPAAPPPAAPPPAASAPVEPAAEADAEHPTDVMSVVPEMMEVPEASTPAGAPRPLPGVAPMPPPSRPLPGVAPMAPPPLPGVAPMASPPVPATPAMPTPVPGALAMPTPMPMPMPMPMPGAASDPAAYQTPATPATPVYMPPGAYAAGPGPRPRSRRRWVAIAISAVVTAAIALGTFTLLRSRSSATTRKPSTSGDTLAGGATQPKPGRPDEPGGSAGSAAAGSAAAGGTGSAAAGGTGSAAASGSAAAGGSADPGAGSAEGGAEDGDPGDEVEDPAAPGGDGLPVVGSGPCRTSITATPAGSIVKVDGNKVGVSPMVLAGPCTRRKLELTHPRYAPVTRFLAPSPDKQESVEVTMVRPTHALTVVTTPPGATISIEGRRAGTSPTVVQITGFNRVKITIEKKGYKTVTQRHYSKVPKDKITVRLLESFGFK